MGVIQKTVIIIPCFNEEQRLIPEKFFSHTPTLQPWGIFKRMKMSLSSLLMTEVPTTRLLSTQQFSPQQV